MGQPLKFSQASYVVDRPRDCDAVGLSLRHVFEVQPPSNDFAELLRRLDRITLPH